MDRSSPEIFGMMFKWLGKGEPSKEAISFAKKLWKASMEYDFTPEYLECDRELIKLGLCEMAVDEDEPDEGKVPFYGLKGDRVR